MPTAVLPDRSGYVPRNTELESLIAECGITYGALADEVNSLGWSAQQVRLGHDKSSVSHWVRRRVPHPPTPELVAAALTAGLGYEVTVEDIGLRRDDRKAERGEGFAVADTPPAPLLSSPRSPDRT